MVNLLTSLLSPIFAPLNVSAGELRSYVEACALYVYIVLGALLVAVVAFLLARRLRRGVKGFARMNCLIAWLLAALVCANAACLGPLREGLSGALDAPSAALAEEAAAARDAVIARVGEEGLVLVRNDGLLPLPSGTKALNVFGWSSTNPVLGGAGSAPGDGSSAVGVLQSLSDAGYATNEELSGIYTAYRADRPVIDEARQDWTLPEPAVDVYTDEVMARAREFSDTAVIVISRSGGEGADLPRDMSAVIRGTYDIAGDVSVAPDNYGYTRASYTNNGDYDDFEPGEHYLELSVTEEKLVEKVCSEFERVVLVVNANNAMELGWIDDYPQIGAVILAPGGGSTGLSALGGILSGAVNPSGRTADTYVYDLTAAPSWNNVGNFSYSNADDLKRIIAAKDETYEGNLAFVNYAEGIYVGYKYYETAAREGAIDYDEQVLFPFGYGLSYTSFAQEFERFDASGDSVEIGVKVTNTGSVAGKDVVELYFDPPYQSGGIEKASVNLIRFGKTGALEPGASETLSFSIPKEDFAAYDDGIKLPGGGYMLEAGVYTVSLRSDSHTVLDEQSFEVDGDIAYTDGRAGDRVPAENRFQDDSRGGFVQLSRADGFANLAEATAAPVSLEMSAEVRARVEEDACGIYDPALHDDPGDVVPTLGAENGKRLYELRGADYGDEAWEPLLDQLSFEDMSAMILQSGGQSAAVESVGKIATAGCGGAAAPSGSDARPTGVLMAQTWNAALIEELGAALGRECAAAGCYGWRGPSMNTHRSAFAGGNFAGYSEDGVLAGYLAAAECNGAAASGVYPWIQRFALNDQETNRRAFLLTFASEQAIREIYLKPFELCVKGYGGAGMACAVAPSWIGTEPCCGSGELLDGVLRGEWGFAGVVAAGPGGPYGYMIADRCVRSGVDLMLGADSDGANAFSDRSATELLAMRRACKNILYTAVNSGDYGGEGDPSVRPGNLTRLVRFADIAGLALLALLELLAVCLLVRGKKKG